MKNISSEEGIAVLNNNKVFRNYRASIISLAEEILAQTEAIEKDAEKTEEKETQTDESQKGSED